MTTIEQFQALTERQPTTPLLAALKRLRETPLDQLSIQAVGEDGWIIWGEEAGNGPE